ncbi:MAG: glycosyltransferase [Actinobacteria bacterium]|nr:glycosyltransferase [Actinomycetota bacterium]
MEKAADRMACILNEWGHEPVVVTQALGEELRDIDRPYPIHFYPRPRSTTWWPWSVSISLSRYHRQYQFDLLWAYQAYPQGHTAVRVGAKLNIPVIISSRGGDISDRSRYLARWLPKRRIQRALKQADAVTTLNRHLSRRVENLTGGLKKANLILNGIDAPTENPIGEPAPQALAQLAGEPFMLTMTRLRRFKGIDLIIEAIRIVQANGKDTPLLVIAGKGQQHDALQKQVSDSRLDGHVCFVGEVSGYEKAWLLANCQFLAHPSREGEGMPNSVLEAMSYGKCVLGTFAPGIEEIVTDGLNGVLAAPDDPKQLAEALDRILNSDMAQLGKHAKQFALENSWEKITRQYITLFEDVLRMRAPQSKSL